jgi:uncharacterized repeat protein (TIGR03803 family)
MAALTNVCSALDNCRGHGDSAVGWHDPEPPPKGWFDGASPFGDLTLSGDGATLYGMTAYGGDSGDGTVFAVSLNPTPEPNTFALLAAAVIGLIGYGWWRRRQDQALLISGASPILGANLTSHEDPQAILPFTPHRECWARRAA